MDNLLNQAKEHFGKAIEFFHHELSTLRTGRASAGLLATVTVNSYGATVPLNQVANISVPDAKTLVVTPWDKSQLGEVEKGILAANLGLTPNNDGNVIRINMPQMTEERRKELVKLVGQMAEKARIAVRGGREEVLKQAKKMEADKEMSEDDLAKFQKHLQDLVDKCNGEIKQIAEDKEKEVMTV